MTRLPPSLQSVALMVAMMGFALGIFALSVTQPLAPASAEIRPAYFLEMDQPFEPPEPEPRTRPLPPARIWLVDGFNVLHASLSGQSREAWWKTHQRQRLLALASGLGADCDEIWVVFDGSDPGPDTEAGERTRAVFAPSADDWIVKRVRRAAEPAKIAVVTGDKQVADRARHKGAVIVSPRHFLAHCPIQDADATPG